MILNQEFWEVSGQFLVTAVSCSPCREKLLLWRSELGLVWVTMGGTIPAIKVLVHFFTWLQVFYRKQSLCVYMQCHTFMGSFAGTSNAQNCSVCNLCYLCNKLDLLRWSHSNLRLKRIRPSTRFGFKLLLVRATVQSHLMLIHWSTVGCLCSHLVFYCQRNIANWNVSRAHAQQLQSPFPATRRKEKIFRSADSDQKLDCKWVMNYKNVKIILCQKNSL